MIKFKENKKVYFIEKKWFTILTLIFFAPIGILIMWLKKHWSKNTRIILTILSIVFFIVVVVSSQQTDDERASEESKQEEIKKSREDKKEQKKKEKKAAEEEKNKEEEKEKEEEKLAEESWNEYRIELIKHYEDSGIVNISAGEGFDFFHAYVPNEFKLATEEEKTYYVEKLGPLLEEDMKSHFGKSVHVYFYYADETVLANRKVTGGWKIK